MTTTCARCGLIHPRNMPCLTQLSANSGHEELAAGMVLADRYRITRTVHRGGMSVVYLAEDLVLHNRRVVLKEMRIPSTAGTEERGEAEAWFAREAYILSSLSNPLIPEFYSAFRESGTSYIVQEYIPGENLNDVITERGPLPEETVVTWAISLCGLLTYLHELDEPVLFRDFKPANILLSDTASSLAGDTCPLKVVDFGIARHYNPGTVGTVIGTPGYAPPEQYQGLTTPQSDVYALGATLHRLLTGYDPEHGTPFTFPAVRGLNPNVSPEMAAIVDRAVRLDPAERYQSAAVMGDALFPLAWENIAARQRQASNAFTQSRHSATMASGRAQRAFRWTAVVVCMMMVAPGILTLMSGVNAHFDDNQRGFTGFLSQPCCAAPTSHAGAYANQNTLGSCLGAPTDGTGGPYPAAATSDCQNQSVVPVFIVPDTRYDVGFSPSNITISRGGAVLFTSQQPGCTIQPWQDPSDSQGPFLQVSFDAPGTYHYSCQENPSISGVIQVR